MEVPLSQIKVTFFVRESLDQSEVERLALLVADGQNVDPIVVHPIKIGGRTFYEVIDGRTRLEAYRSWEYETIPVRLYKGDDDLKSKMIAAIRANDNEGPRALNRKDIIRGVRKLKESGATDQEVKAAFPSYPKFVREAIQMSRSNLQQAKVNKALSLMRDEDHSIKAAALMAGVSEDEVKARLGQKKGEESRALHLQKRLGGANRSYGRSIQELAKSIEASFEEGEVSMKVALGLLEHMKAHAQKSLRVAEDRIARFLSTHEQGKST